MRFDSDAYDLSLGGRRSLRVRPLRPTDRDIYEHAVIDLSPRSRYLRFLAPIPRPSKQLLDLMTAVDGRDHVASMALVGDEASAVGVVRHIRDPEQEGVAEVAMAIADDWQGRGVGRELLRLTVEQARRSGLRTLRATTLHENWGAARLLRASGFSHVGPDGVYSEFALRLG